ncbi:MAG: PAS domain S-box protein [Methanoregulaceae archaeon]
MQQPFDDSNDQEDLRARIIGLGERSARKSYYPVLQERLRELERFRALLEETSDLIFVVREEDHRVIDANQTCSRLLGYSHLQLTQKQIEELVHREEYSRIKDAFASAARQLRSGKFETRLISSDGADVAVEISLRLVSFGKERYAILLARDITERKAYEGALLQVQKKLKMINHLTRNDIRNQIFILRGYIEILRRTGMDQETLSVIGKMEGAITVMNERIDLAGNFQDLGSHAPRWHNLQETFLFALSHTDSLRIDRSGDFGSIEIFADPLLEEGLTRVLMFLIATRNTGTIPLRISYAETCSGLRILFEVPGRGLPVSGKKILFSWEYCIKDIPGLFFVREILAITAISIDETGNEGTGIRLEIGVPRGTYRMVPEDPYATVKA